MERGTCGFCGGNFSVGDRGLSHHGFRRPGNGRTLGRCPGVKHPPLEVDRSTLDLLISYLQGSLAGANRSLTELAAAQEITVSGAGFYRTELEGAKYLGDTKYLLTREHPLFLKVQERQIKSLTAERDEFARRLAQAEKDYAEWKRAS